MALRMEILVWPPLQWISRWVECRICRGGSPPSPKNADLARLAACATVGCPPCGRAAPSWGVVQVGPPPPPGMPTTQAGGAVRAAREGPRCRYGVLCARERPIPYGDVAMGAQPSIGSSRPRSGQWQQRAERVGMGRETVPGGPSAAVKLGSCGGGGGELASCGGEGDELGETGVSSPRSRNWI
jgi:hypothetical protein